MACRRLILPFPSAATPLLVLGTLLLLQLVSVCGAAEHMDRKVEDYSWRSAIEADDEEYPSFRDLQQLQGDDVDYYCEIPIKFDPAKGHKPLYTIGVLGIRGPEDAYLEFNATFSDYLSETAGKRFDPPIRFEMKYLDFVTLFTDVETQAVDYIYVNPSAYSCIESEFEAESLVSQVSRREVGDQVYDLKKFGGVIATLAERDDIQTVKDLKNKVVAAASISGLGSGQLQFNEMISRGMNYLQDPKQLVFTSNQGTVVNGLLSGDFDVGFVRTDQLERTTDADGNLVPMSKFKIIEPKPGLEIDGVPFPFQSSTELYAEWNVGALTHVSPTVSREVQRALLSIADYGKVGQALSECVAVNGTDYCENVDLWDIYEGPLKCSATHAVVASAFTAQTNGTYAGWTTSLSYMPLRTMQEATGFISMEPETRIWRCVRSEEIYDAITCPAGYNRKTQAEVENGCAEAGLECLEGYQCICRPCELPYELVCVNSIKVNGRCVSLAIFLPCIILSVLLVVGVLVHFYVEYKRKQSDSLWIVQPSQLEFGDPPTVIGRGTFGLVLLADYRGTSVAVKRVIPSSGKERGNARLFDASRISDSRSSTAGDDEDVESGYNMHPGMQSMAPGKLKQHLKQQARKRTDLEADHAASRNVFQRVKHKLLHGCDDSLKDAEAHARLKAEFVCEIRQLARLRHPCITTVMGAVMPTRHDEPMLIMEYMSHGSLYDVLRDSTIILKPEQILAILQDVAQGLRFLHSATPQVVHGDLKAQNVLIDTNFCAKVTDFGLSGKKQIGAVGTPYWMSPELLQENGVNTTASDMYAYGMVMYEIYSGRAPYAGEAFEDVVKDICNPYIRKRPPIPLHCPAKIAKIMADCFEHDPLERPSAEQLDLALKVELKVKERTSRLEALNKDLEEANNRIASASAMQLQHFACMSHEIRTPLNCIIGLSSLLEETELNSMQKESMEMIVSSGKLLRQIVDDVLDYSKLESGNAQVLVQKINLQDTLNAVIHLIKTSNITTEKKLNVVTYYDPLLPENIYSDSRRIQQILYNLLGNAIKFSGEAGTVEFRVSVLPSSAIVRFSVKDFGKGIESSDFGKIFEPFRQTETGLSNTAGGTGLGLAITKKLVDAMGGTIAVDSEYGSWTQFTVDFPFGGNNKPASIPDLSARLQKATVLFVADGLDPDTARVESYFEQFNTEYSHFNSMRHLNQALLMREGPFATYTDAYICLSHEDLCDLETFELLVANLPAALVTFGPKFSIERMTRKHWRSLVETFPSVLVHKLGSLALELRNVTDTGNLFSLDVDESKSPWADLRVLIAEDNIVNQKVLTRILNRLGVDAIKIARNGVEAVEMEAKEAFDLVLMDMQMPKMDGIEACRAINLRKIGPDNHVLAKVIFVTAHVSDTFRQTCLDNGAIGYLPKPCTVEGVKEVLHHSIGTGSLYSPAYGESWNRNTAPPVNTIMDSSERSNVSKSRRSTGSGVSVSFRFGGGK